MPAIKTRGTCPRTRELPSLHANGTRLHVLVMLVSIVAVCNTASAATQQPDSALSQLLAVSAVTEPTPLSSLAEDTWEVYADSELLDNMIARALEEHPHIFLDGPSPAEHISHWLRVFDDASDEGIYPDALGLAELRSSLAQAEATQAPFRDALDRALRDACSDNSARLVPVRCISNGVAALLALTLGADSAEAPDADVPNSSVHTAAIAHARALRQFQADMTRAVLRYAWIQRFQNTGYRQQDHDALARFDANGAAMETAATYAGETYLRATHHAESIRGVFLIDFPEASVDSAWQRRQLLRLAALADGAVDVDSVRALASALRPEFPIYQTLVEHLAALRQRKLAGGWIDVSDVPGLYEGLRHRSVPALRQRLTEAGYDAQAPEGDPEDSPELTYDANLAAAVTAFQSEHRIPTDGRFDGETRRRLKRSIDEDIAELVLSLEQVRESQRSAWNGGRFIWSNLPSFDAGLYDETGELRTWRIMIGRRSWYPDRRNPNETPVMTASLDYFVLNPSWYVPNRIWRNSLLDRYGDDAAALEEAGYELLGGEGELARVRQLPGPDNALGLVKFIFPNHGAIFMHDTKSKHLFSNTRRTASNGCLRAEDPLGTAALLLSLDREISLDEAETEIRQIIARGRERRVSLRRPVPVFFDYVTADDIDGRLVFYADVYLKLPTRLQTLLQAEADLRADNGGESALAE